MNLISSNSANPLSTDYDDSIDLSQCDREEIRFPAAIMPHGSMLVLQSTSLQIVGVSENICHYLNVEGSAENLDSWRNGFPQQLWQDLGRISKPYLGRYLFNDQQLIDIHVFRSGDYLLLEIERIDNQDIEMNSLDAVTRVNDCMTRLRQCETEMDLAQTSIDLLRSMTGYDTVLFIRMNEDGTMQAEAESANGQFPSFLDKRFPSSDVPAPARKKMLTQPMIYAPDICYQPVQLLPLDNDLDTTRLDLSDGALRSLSQLCNQYYMNVGIQAKLVLPLVEQNQQWGIVILWNSTPKTISPTRRLQVRTFLDIAGQLMHEKRLSTERQQLLKLGSVVDDFVEDLESHASIDAGIELIPSFLLNHLDCCGAVCRYDEQIYTAGLCPDHKALVDLSYKVSSFLCERDMQDLTAMENGQTVRITGVLALPLVQWGAYVAIFRKEQVAEVTWAGDPRKPVIINPASGEKRLTARGSFEAWKQEVKQLAAPWELIDKHSFQRFINGFSRQQARKQAFYESENKARYLAEISHELRSPLNAVAGIAKQLQSSRLDESGNQINQLNLSVEHLLRLVNGVLDLSKIDAGKMFLETIAFDPRQLLDNCLQMIDWQAAEKNINVKLDIADLPDSLLGDPTRLTQMLLNYLNNALKFTASGQVTVSVEIQEQYDNQLKLVFSVRDTGPGIAADKLKTLFNAYQQADSSTSRTHGGTGLGLAINQKLAKLMNGHVGAQSTVGEGSCFWFSCWLETADQQSQPAETEIGQKDPLQMLQNTQQKIKVLIVDDEFFNVAITERLLELADIPNDAAANGETALEKIFSGDFDLVLLDMHLDDISGLEIAQQVRNRQDFNHVGLMALTGETRSEFKQACEAAGMNGYLLKPIQEDLFFQALLDFQQQRFN